MTRRPHISVGLSVAAVVAVVALVGAVALLLHGRGTSPSAEPDRATRSSDGRPSSGRLVPATSRRPAGGVCGRTTGAVLTVRIEPDTPDPRCSQVTAAQRLRVVNRTGDYGAKAHPVTVVWVPGRSLTLRPGEAKTFAGRFGTYLARGVHELSAGPGYRSEVWLR